MLRTEKESKGFFFDNLKKFPAVIDGEINIVKFLEASTFLVSLVERLGKAFAPVKYDMQGNIDKINKNFEYDNNTCILKLMEQDVKINKLEAVEGVLWLNRAIYFFEIVFQEIINNIQHHNIDIPMKNVFTHAYESSVKKYHNWVTQQLFSLICKMSPSLPQILKSLEVNNNIKEFEMAITNLNVTLHLVRTKIDDFFKENDLFEFK